MLDDQPAARRGIHREGNVAGEGQSGHFRLHGCVDGHPPALDGQPGALGQVAPRSDAQGTQHQIGVHVMAIGQRDPMPINDAQ